MQYHVNGFRPGSPDVFTAAPGHRRVGDPLPPTVDVLSGEYADGVRLSKAQMKPIEARLERSKTLPKYDILIRPQTPLGG